MRLLSVANAVAWRMLHTFFTNASLILPSLLFPLFFVSLFISSMAMPRNLIGVTWFRDVATANPVSYLLECVRSLIITGWDPEALALGFGIVGLVAVVGLSLSSMALPNRLAR